MDDHLQKHKEETHEKKHFTIYKENYIRIEFSKNPAPVIALEAYTLTILAGFNFKTKITVR